MRPSVGSKANCSATAPIVADLAMEAILGAFVPMLIRLPVRLAILGLLNRTAEVRDKLSRAFAPVIAKPVVPIPGTIPGKNCPIPDAICPGNVVGAVKGFSVSSTSNSSSPVTPSAAHSAPSRIVSYTLRPP